ncbi:reverse transcriptase domain-containing protein [Vallitalea guaymasensis]|uniref:Reverse transcriptase domain-containing protein n=1 Tax=Vallitalea guaymasensis TaxID=1185412 RepID=A0A8J8M976_9FIRM|nr:reverse transcriptase domain-containing protein [Vallitalea guaymasensis]QUH28712.1 hypothetical protein HYG85_07215 [Vallitalea guaymasensis]
MNFNTYFTKKNINKSYEEIKKGRLTTGIDRISRRKFEKNKQAYFDIIYRKINNNSYKFTKYKQILAIKDEYNKPRIISIPTIRDKIVLNIIRQILDDTYKNIIRNDSVSNIIKKIAIDIKNYDYCFTLDISNFYGMINHNILMHKLRNNTKSNKLHNIIDLAITTQTVNIEASSKKEFDLINDIGIPQGVSISNLLANIYLMDFDDKHYNHTQYSYFRYVDDIIVFCHKNKSKAIRQKMINELTNNRTYALKINAKKCTYNEIFKNTFIEFLGYRIYYNSCISIKDMSIKKFEKSLEKIFHDYINSKEKHIKGNKEYLKWKLNLKITGCVRNNIQYGWVKYYKLCDKDEVFYKLDWLIVNLIKRFKLGKFLLSGNNKYIGKKFSKTYYEIKHNNSSLTNSKYIPNIDNYSIEKKCNILSSVCKRKIDTWSHNQINYEFDKFIFKSIRELEQDLQGIYG